MTLFFRLQMLCAICTCLLHAVPENLFLSTNLPLLCGEHQLPMAIQYGQHRHPGAANQLTLFAAAIIVLLIFAWTAGEPELRALPTTDPDRLGN